MADKYPYQKLPNYPHLKPADILIWERFIDKFPKAYDFCQYDLTVGEGRPDWSHADPAINKSGAILTSRKIDVVGYKNNYIDVIEVKPKAGLGAIGQVIGYEDLYRNYREPTSEPNMVIITDEYTGDMKWLCARLGINLMVV